MRNIASECCNFQNSKAHAVFAKQTEAFYVLKFRRGYFLITRLKVKRKRACLRRVLLAAHEWSVSKNDNAWLAMTHCTLCQGYLFRFHTLPPLAWDTLGAECPMFSIRTSGQCIGASDDPWILAQYARTRSLFLMLAQ